MPVMWKQWLSHETTTGPGPAAHQARNTGQMHRCMQDTLSRRHNCDCYPRMPSSIQQSMHTRAHTAVLTDATHSSLQQAAYLFQYNSATAAAAHKTACQAPHTPHDARGHAGGTKPYRGTMHVGERPRAALRYDGRWEQV